MRKTKLRRRRTASPVKTTASPSAAPSDTAGSASDSRAWLKSALLNVVHLVAPVFGGVIAAASLQKTSVAVAVFVVSVVAMILTLFRVFYSMLKQKDQTPIPLSKLYNADGTVTEQPVFTVFDHDNKVATKLSSELLMFAVAAVWMCLWSGYMSFFLMYSAFFLYRLFYHPLFRIHFWNESAHPDLKRPFGATPIFEKTPESAVKVVEGREQFRQLLKSTAKGCLVVLDCSASWCGPCRAMAPQFSKLAEQFKDTVFVTIDVDISLDLASDLRVTSIPSFYFYRDETLLRSEIAPSPKKLQQIIESYL